jgi:hypothetical protein
MKSRIISNRKKAEILVSPETVQLAIQQANDIATKLLAKNPNDNMLDELEAASTRLQHAGQNLSDPMTEQQAKKDVDFIAQIRRGQRPQRIDQEAPMAATAAGTGSDGFVTDRNEQGEPKAPERLEVPRVAAKKKRSRACSSRGSRSGQGQPHRLHPNRSSPEGHRGYA